MALTFIQAIIKIGGTVTQRDMKADNKAVHGAAYVKF